MRRNGEVRWAESNSYVQSLHVSEIPLWHFAGMLKDIGTFLNLCYGFSGRVSRSQFYHRLSWVPFIAYLPFVPICAIMEHNDMDFSTWPEKLIVMPFFWSLSTLAVKRLRDIGKSGYWFVTYFGGGVSLALAGQHLFSDDLGQTINAAGALLMVWGLLELIFSPGKQDLLPPDSGQQKCLT